MTTEAPQDVSMESVEIQQQTTRVEDQVDSNVDESNKPQPLDSNNADESESPPNNETPTMTAPAPQTETEDKMAVDQKPPITTTVDPQPAAVVAPVSQAAELPSNDAKKVRFK